MVLVFWGKNSYLARVKIRELVARYKEKNQNDFGIERFVGEDLTKADQVVEAMTALPFLSGNRLVICEDVLGRKELADDVLKAFDRVPDSTVAVFYEPSLNARSALHKQLRDKAKVYEFPELDDQKLVAWIVQEAKKRGGEIAPVVARMLLEHVGHDQWRLSSEIEKLSLSGDPITEERIRGEVIAGFEKGIFDLITTLSQGRLAEALRLYDGLRQTQAEPIYIVSMLGWQWRALMIVSAAEGRDTGTIAADSKLSPYVINNARKLVSRLSFDRLQQGIDKIAEVDTALKSTSNDPDVMLSTLMSDLSEILSGHREKAIS